MKTLNTTILILFSLSGIVSAQEELVSFYLMEWSDILFIFPASLLTGIFLLGISIINYPINTWEKFSWNNFALNPTQPHSFIMFLGLIFTLAGVLGLATAFIQQTDYYKTPAYVFCMGSGIFISGILGCLFVSLKQRKLQD